MRPNVYVIQTTGQDVFFGFIADYPAICAQADSVQAVQAKLKDFSKSYFDYMSSISLDIDSPELIMLG